MSTWSNVRQGIVSSQKDYGFLGLFMIILALLIFPLPRILMDFSLALLIALSLLILSISLVLRTFLDFSAFPTILLISTLFRLSLNVASTRLILSHGHEGTHAAGSIIQTFGALVMGGNFVIGLLIFTILVLINFVVITKGSTRIAEVAARFSLDAMPGKQMAIDADLSAGLLTQEEAQKKRQDMQEESSFFGAMDGAAKFIRGDAIAGIIITTVNIIGGISIGVLQRNLSLAQALHTYTFLTVGDGLVAQIPALMISVAAGMLISKTGSRMATHHAIVHQLKGYNSALFMCAFLLMGVGLLPGLPFIPFALLGAGMMGLGIKNQTPAHSPAAVSSLPTPALHNTPQQWMKLEAISLTLGHKLTYLAQNAPDHLPGFIQDIRKKVAQDKGVLIPSIPLGDDITLEGTAYRIHVKGLDAGQGIVHPKSWGIMSQNSEVLPEEWVGIKTQDPVFQKPMLWTQDAHLKDQALQKNYLVMTSASLMAAHLSHVIHKNLAHLFSFYQYQERVDTLDKAYQKLYLDLVPQVLSAGTVHHILQNLLKEHVPIRDFPLILEALSDYQGTDKSPQGWTEHVRQRLGHYICDTYKSATGHLPIITLDTRWEDICHQSLKEHQTLFLPPDQLETFMKHIHQAFTANPGPVFLVSGLLRPFLRKLLARFRPDIVVISQHEVPLTMPLDIKGTVA